MLLDDLPHLFSLHPYRDAMWWFLPLGCSTAKQENICFIPSCWNFIFNICTATCYQISITGDEQVAFQSLPRIGWDLFKLSLENMNEIGSKTAQFVFLCDYFLHLQKAWCFMLFAGMPRKWLRQHRFYKYNTKGANATQRYICIVSFTFLLNLQLL